MDTMYTACLVILDFMFLYNFYFYFYFYFSEIFMILLFICTYFCPRAAATPELPSGDE